MSERLLRVSLILIISFTAYSCGVVMISNVNKNSRVVNSLELRTTKQEVFSLIGSPDIRKAQVYEGGQLEILYYKTWIQAAVIGIEYAAAFTPLYFYDGVLVMIGDQVSAQYLNPIATMNAFSQAFPSRKQIDVFIYNK